MSVKKGEKSVLECLSRNTNCYESQPPVKEQISR